MATFENMQYYEQMYKKNNPNTTLKFVREGKIKTKLEKENVEDYILMKTKHIREQLGYK